MATAISSPFRILINASIRGAQDFATRRSQPGVVRWFGFDSPAELGNPRWPAPFGTVPASGTSAIPQIDTTVATVPGGGSLKLTLPQNLGVSGDWYANFSDNLQTQFDAGEEFFVQWRQRFSREIIAINSKQMIITVGDISLTSSNGYFASCTALECVVTNTTRQLAQMYHSCPSPYGTSSMEEGIDRGNDFKLQNARGAPYCLRSQGFIEPFRSGFFPPVGNCFGYFPNEWMTFKVALTLGPRVQDTWPRTGNPSGVHHFFDNSRIRMWIGRQGQASELCVDIVHNLHANEWKGGAVRARYGKVWVTARGLEPATHPQASTWYDELIISRKDIADPL